MEISLNGIKLDYFNSFKLGLKYDAIASVFSFDAYFDPKNKDHQLLLKPCNYSSCVVTHNGKTIITGTILNNNFSDEPTKQLVSISGYSKTGILGDCPIPLDAYPLQSQGLNLTQIATKLLKPFSLEMEIDSLVLSEMNKVFSSSTASENQTVIGYLSELAVQRNIIITHNEYGKVLFTRANTKKQPILFFDSQKKPATKISLNVKGQDMHSSITVVKQASIDGGNAGQSTVTNPYVKTYRPTIITQSSGTDSSTNTCAKAALAIELKNISLNVDIDRWDIDSNIIPVGSIISVISDELFLYKKTNFFVEEISYSGDSKSMTASLKCGVLEVYNGETPVNIFE